MLAQLAVRLVVLSLIVSSLLVSGQDDVQSELSPRIILHKHSATDPVVEGRDFVVTYQLVNTGNAIATNIDIADNYDIKSFEAVDNVDSEGFVSRRFEELAPSMQASFNVTVRPKLSGVYESTRARIRYVNGAAAEDGLEETRQGYSTALGRTRILSTAEFERLTSYFVKEWVTLLVLCALPVVFPLNLYLKATAATSLWTAKSKSK